MALTGEIDEEGKIEGDLKKELTFSKKRILVGKQELEKSEKEANLSQVWQKSRKFGKI